MMEKLTTSVVLLAVLSWAAGCAESRTAAPGSPTQQDADVKESLKAAARRELAVALVDRDSLLRMHAVEAVKDALGTAGQNQILLAMNDSQPPVRFAATMAAGELRLQEAMPALRRMLVQDNDPHIQLAVIFAMHRLGDVRHSAGLEQAIRSPDPEVRADTALALGRLAEKTAVRILRPVLKDPAVATRLQAAEALWRLGDEEGLKYLVAAALSGHPAQKMFALLALAGPRNHAVIEHVRAGLDSEYLEVSLVAARSLGMLGSDEAYTLAANTTRSAEWRQRHLAAMALGAIGRPDAQDLLAPLLKDPEGDVRLAAAAAILQLR